MLISDQIKLHDTSIILQNSHLGWIVAGRIDERNNKTFKCNLMQNETELDLKCFWDLEELGIKDDPNSVKNEKIVENFNETVRFTNNRYEINLPWIRDWRQLQDNYKIAEMRLMGLIKRMKRNNTLFEEYQKVLNEYLNLNIIERVSNSESPSDKPVFYLPHHCVFREDSVYTKCRVVFDASSHEAGQLSLNDCLDAGSNLNPNIFNLLIFFRLNKVAILADIEKAFLQISINEKDRDVLRFLFVDTNAPNNDSFNIIKYKFLRLTFGLNSSPFLLAATIQHHLNKLEKEYPMTTEILKRCIYVDDVITGTDTVEEAITISKQSHKIMQEASMNLRKWISNHDSLMNTWDNLGFSTLPKSSRYLG